MFLPATFVPDWHINAADYQAEWSSAAPLRRIFRESMETIRQFICGHPKSIASAKGYEDCWNTLIVDPGERTERSIYMYVNFWTNYLLLPHHLPQLFAFAIKFPVPVSLLWFTLTVSDIADMGSIKWRGNWKESESNRNTHDCILDWHTWVGGSGYGWYPPPDSVIKTDVTRWRWRWKWRAAAEGECP